MKTLRPIQQDAINQLRSSLAREVVVGDLTFRRIAEYPRYWVSANGDVVSTVRSGRELKQSKTPQGYPYVSLLRNGEVKKICVHRLVAECFLAGSGECVNHVNGVKHDNSVKNLEWCSYSENNNHARDNKLVKNFGEEHYAAKLKNDDIREIFSMAEQGMLHREIAEHFPVRRQAITKILNGQAWRRSA